MTFQPSKFFDALRSGILGPSLDQGEVSGCNAILGACDGLPLSWAAYAFATAFHETAFTMQPVREFGGPRYFTKMYDVTGSRPKLARANGNVNVGDGVRYCGRGYVQLTWRNNYRRAGQRLSIDLEGNPDLALEPEIAAKIMREGMKGGWFTGKSFGSYLPGSGPADKAAFTQARWIINGTDKAAKIAGYAVRFQDALKAGGWA